MVDAFSQEDTCIKMSNKTAIIIAVYNGTNYLKDQLDSIRKQTISVDRVLLGDDCSTDGTVQFIKSYIKEYQLTNWELICREKNIGWKANFIDLLQRCREEYIFFSDQDDIWREDKCEKLLDAMNQTQNALCMASDMEVHYISDAKHIARVHMEGDPWQAGTIEQVKFARDFDVVKRPGCTYCFRRELARMALEAWNPEDAHDAVVWTLANIMDGLYILHEKLMTFQRHGSSVTSVLPRKTRQEMMRYLKNYLRFDEKMVACAKEHGAPEVNVRYIEEHRHFLEMRYRMFENRSPFGLLAMQIRYGVYYPKWRSLLADYYYMFHSRKV